MLVDRAELTSGSTFHSAGLVGQLRADPTLTRMNMYSVELYRRLQQTEHAARLGRVRRHPARVVAGADGGDPPADQLGHGVRAAAAGDLGRRGARAVPADRPDGRRRRGLPRLGRLRRPVAALLRAGRTWRAADGRAGAPAHAGHRHRRRARPGDAGCTPTGAAIECEVVVDCGGMFAAEIARMVGVRVPLVPMSHQYVVTEAFLDRRDARRCRRCATPTCSSTSARRSTAW